MQTADDISTFDQVLSLSTNISTFDRLAYQNLESWHLNAEPYSCSPGYTQQEQEVTLFDYELSGLI